MNTLLNVINVSFARGSVPLFENISLSINTGDRVGLVGHNGSGKSSLLSLISGAETPDEGEIRMPRGQKVAMVEQFVPSVLSQMSLIDAVLEILPVEERQQNRYQADELLAQLGFSVAHAELPLHSLSGGQQNLALLARAILLQPELLLMDEPGNHMDVMALQYLQQFLHSGHSGSLLMISHDRELLNSCCNRTVFLRDQRLYSFELPFDAASKALAERDVQAAKARHEEQTTLSRGSGLELHVETESLRSKSLLTIEKAPITIPGGGQRLLDIEFQYIRPGDRIALLGRNGVGKSTTINRLVDAIGTFDERIRVNPNVQLGYYDQELSQFQGACGRIDWLRERCELPDAPIKSVLLQNGVAYRDFDQPVNTLSGGECARLMFMLFQLNKPNLLILDEPTNHIDIQGREQLERQLVESGATLIITSHDRRFIERVANRWWWINNRKLVELNGLEEFYAVISDDATSDAKSVATSKVPHTSGVPATDNQDDLLARIEALETLLSADRARKPKFQKPDRQLEWEREIDILWQKLD